MRPIARIATLVLALSAAAFASACGGSVSTSHTADEATSKQALSTPSHGPVRLLGDALGDVPLRPEQRAEIEKLASDAEARHAGVAAAHRQVVEALAAQIEAGAIDRAALKPKIDAAAKAWEGARPADRAAIERLHAILDADQRSELVDAIESRVHAKMEAHPWRERMEEWSRDLKLTDDQKARIGQALHAQLAGGGRLHEMHEGATKGKRALEAFKQDRFVIDEAMPPSDLQAHAAGAADHIVGVASAVLPILTAEQRTLAAQKVRAHAAAGDDPTQ